MPPSLAISSGNHHELPNSRQLEPPLKSKTFLAPKSPTSPYTPSGLSREIENDDSISRSSSSKDSDGGSSPTTTDFTTPDLRASKDEYFVSAENGIKNSKPYPVVPYPQTFPRKHSEKSTRSGFFSTRKSRSKTTEGQKPNSETLADLARQLRPPAARWSQESSNTVGSSGRPVDMAAVISNGAHSERPGTAPGQRKSQSSGHPAPSLRPSTSIPDYESGKSNRDTAVTDPLPQKQFSPHTSLHSTINRSPTFWRDGGVNSIRESIRSAMTNGSSTADFSSIARSSLLTDRSSTSEGGNEYGAWPRIREDDEFSVDDCISMYAAGFHDDPDNTILEEPSDKFSIPPVPPMPPDALIRRDSDTLPPGDSAISQPSLQELQDSESEVNALPARMGTSERKSSPPTNPRIFTDMTSIKHERDLYGFKKETQYVSLQRYNEWERKYHQYLRRRREKWIHLMNESGLPSHQPERFPPKSAKLKRYIRKGIPPDWRGAAWFWYADGASFVTSNPGLYDRLVVEAEEGSISDSDREHIERDLHRTFPDNRHFKPDSTASPTGDSSSSEAETDMIRSLRRILQAFAVHHPKIGYCQSLNFLAGQLLLFMRSAFADQNYEERAFVMLCILTSRYLPGTHGVVLEGANADIGVLMTFIRESMPSLWAKLDDNSDASSTMSSPAARNGSAGLPTISLATTAWFMSCFVSTLPVETACRVWDCLWYENSKTIFRVALAIFKMCERDIRRSKEPMEVFQVVQSVPRSLLDANTLMDIATRKSKMTGGATIKQRIGPGVGGFGGLSQKTVEARREERRQLCKSERERLMGGGLDEEDGAEQFGIKAPPIPDDYHEDPAPRKKSLSRSSSRSRLKRLKSMRKTTG